MDIETKPSRAKVRSIAGHQVRYLQLSKIPDGYDSTVRAVEVDGQVDCLVVCHGKSYADPSLPSAFTFTNLDAGARWPKMGVENWNRDGAVEWWIKNRGTL